MIAKRVAQGGARFEAEPVGLAVDIEGDRNGVGAFDFGRGCGFGFGFEKAGGEDAAADSHALQESAPGKIYFLFRNLGFFLFAHANPPFRVDTNEYITVTETGA